MGLFELGQEMLFVGFPLGVILQRAAGPVREITVPARLCREVHEEQPNGDLIGHRQNRTCHCHRMHVAGHFPLEGFQQLFVTLAGDAAHRPIAIRLQQIEGKTGRGGLRDALLQRAVRGHRLQQRGGQPRAEIQFANDSNEGPDVHLLIRLAVTNKAGLYKAERLEKDRVGAEAEIGARGVPQAD